MSQNVPLSPKQQQAVQALLDCPTVHAAATALKINPRTLFRWLKEAPFRAAYREARRDLVEAATARLQQLTMQATLTLSRNLTCGNPSAEIRAATAILEQARSGVELLDLAEEVATIKETLARGNGHGRPRP